MVALSDKSLTTNFTPAKLTANISSFKSSPEEISAIVQSATRICYPSSSILPYHGQGHPQVTWNYARKLIERVRACGITVNEHAVRDGVALHDAFSQIIPEFLGFKDPEHLASHFSYNFLRYHGASEEYARLVERIIVASNPFADPKLPEEIIMRAADLGNLQDEYAEFRGASLAFHREMELKAGKSIPWDSHLPGCYRYLSIFLWRMLAITPEAYDKEGRSRFHTNALQNLCRFAREQLKETPIEMVAEVLEADSKPSTLQERSTSGVFHIALHHNAHVRERYLKECLNEQLPKASEGFRFVVQGKADAIPATDGSLDRVVLHSACDGMFEEAKRALKSGGMLELLLPLSISPLVTKQLIDQALKSSFILDCVKTTEGGRLIHFKRIDLDYESLITRLKKGNG